MNTNKTPSKEYSHRLVLIASLFTTVLITSNLIAVKIITIGTFILPAAILLFPISYIIGDVLTEVYGYAKARQVIWIGFACNIFAILAIWIAGVLPAADFWINQDSWNNILGLVPRILFASLIAYLIGEFANAYILAKVKVITKGKFLWLRTISSTIVGQALDSTVFIFIAFVGNIPTSTLIVMIFTQWIVKTLYEIAMTPITYVSVNYLKRVDSSDVYDDEIDFNPISIKS